MKNIVQSKNKQINKQKLNNNAQFSQQSKQVNLACPLTEGNGYL